MNSPIPGHLGLDALLAYWLHETDEAATDAVDEHLMRCDACGAALDELVALGEGVRAAFRHGEVSGVLGAAFVQRMAAHGMKVREYRLPHNGGVNCSVAPDDDLLVARLELPSLQGVQRLDAVATLSIGPQRQERLRDVPFDPDGGELVYAPRLAQVRQLPAHEMRLTLLAVDGGRERELGHYTFRHRPWTAG